MDNLTQKAREAIIGQRLIPSGAGVLAGVSGGADSVALLHVLHRLGGELGFTLRAAHLHHGIRGAEADGDEEFVRKLCAGLGVELAVERADIPALARERGQTLEQAAREARYAFFRRVMAETGAVRVAVAHHMEDQAESLLLHLIRGSGLKGLTAMQPRRGEVIRPFLTVRRGEIEAYLTAHGIPYRTDGTNLGREAARNRLRLDVLPYIQAHLNANIVETLCSAAELLGEDEEYLAAAAAAALESCTLDGGYDRAALAALEPPIRSRALRLALERAGACCDIERRHIELITGLLTARTGAGLDLPGIRAEASYGLLRLGQREAPEDYEIPFNMPGKTIFPGGYLIAEIAEDGIIKDNTVAYMDMAALTGELTVRRRRPGDRFRPMGAPGSKKLKELFIDRKVPRAQREVPILFRGREALFIPGCGIGEEVKVGPDTRCVLRVRLYDEKGRQYTGK